MQDIIDKTIKRYRKKNEKLEVLKNYLKRKYKMNIDIASIENRIKALEERERHGYSFHH